MYIFDAKKVSSDCIEWIRDWFSKNGPDCKAVVGISGGKDSSVVAALCVKALGRERVYGVLMPQGVQADIDYSVDLCETLGIEYITVNVKNAIDAVMTEIEDKIDVTNQTRFNLPPRIRMSVLYAVSQSVNGRVANTCNLSEDWVGYSTRYGDSVGDFSPLSLLTVQEVKAVGREIGLPERFIEKTPIDGLCGKSDEDNLGFTYAVLDRYIREGVIDNPETKKKIDGMHERNLFKLQLMPVFQYHPDVEVSDA
ncbi:MAG: NAD(+) synthase [Clostridia bacterium]|nr:NAD(+) synthase [Clostridia bacterium]MBR3594353.1 NAD(+) synthase [Clostridia bacterium]